MVRVLFPVLMLSAVLSGAARAQGAAIDWEGGVSAPLNLPQALDASGPKTPSAPAAPLCVVELQDKTNKFSATFIASMGPADKGVRVHTVVLREAPRKPGEKGRDEERWAKLRGDNDPISTDGGVPELTPNQILSKYKADVDALMKDKVLDVAPNAWRTWTLPAGSPCKPVDLSMTMFWVAEWYYDG